MQTGNDLGASTSLQSLEEQTRQTMLQLFADSHSGLQAVEARMKSRFTSDSKIISAISSYLLNLGGKRVRPLLALSAGRLFQLDHPSEELIDAAAGIEMIHMATLLHDDIIDDSPVRRHQTSPLRKYGMAETLLAGDFLLARAFGLCAHLDRFVIEATEQACVELTEGEILEGTLKPGETRSLEEYLIVVEKKTASLFKLAATVGAHIAGAPDASVKKMEDFGRNAGIAFQMVDDILDVTAEEDLLGKPTGTDLRQKTPSLVNILWLLSNDAEARKFFDSPSPSPEETRKIALSLRSSSVVEEARTLALKFGDSAKQSLLSLPEDQINFGTRASLLALVDYTLERCS